MHEVGLPAFSSLDLVVRVRKVAAGINPSIRKRYGFPRQTQDARNIIYGLGFFLIPSRWIFVNDDAMPWRLVNLRGHDDPVSSSERRDFALFVEFQRGAAIETGAANDPFPKKTFTFG